MSKQLRNFVFTWNNPYGEKIGTLEAAHDKMVHLRELLPIQYIIYGVEKGEKGTPHFQAISNFKSELPLTLSNGLLIIVISSLAEVASSKLLSIAEKKGTFTNGEVPRIKAIVRIYNLLNVLWSLIVLLRLY